MGRGGGYHGDGGCNHGDGAHSAGTGRKCHYWGQPQWLLPLRAVKVTLKACGGLTGSFTESA